MMAVDKRGIVRNPPLFLVCLAMTALAAVLRIVTQWQSWTQIDEPSSLLAAKMVAQHGAPMFPSGVLYLQGATISYLIAPLYRVLDPDVFLNVAQAIMLAIGLAVVPIAMVLTRHISGSTAAAAIAGALVATDPALTMWSITIRPYGLLAVLTIATVYVGTRIATDGADVRVLGLRAVIWLPILGTLGTFTHIGYWLVFPGLALSMILVYRRSLFGSARAIVIWGAAPLIAPVIFVLLGRYVGVGSGTTGVDTHDAIVGSHLFSLHRVIADPTLRWTTWTANFSLGPLHTTMPLLIVLASGLTAMWAVTVSDTRRALAVVPPLLVHWSAIVIVGIVLVFDAQSRYLLHVVPLGYVLVACAAWSIWTTVAMRELPARIAVRMALLLVLVMPMFATTIAGSVWRSQQPGYGFDTDYWQITEWVDEHHQPGEAVLTALPPAAAFWFDPDGTDGALYFLAGREGTSRATRYAKTLDDGTVGDYWLGTPVIDSTRSLCLALRDNAGHAWVIVDESRLEAAWAFDGSMADVMLGSTVTRYRSRSQNTLALFVLPQDDWSGRAARLCTRAIVGI